MTKFIEKPNLPEKHISRVICGKIPTIFTDFLKKRNIEILFCEDNNDINFSVRNHADMSSVYLGKNKIIVDCKQTSLINKLIDYNFNVVTTKESIKGEYPFDISLNVALFSDNAVGNFKFSDQALIESIESFRKFNVKQGYSKCSVLPISEEALITDDISVYNSVKNAFDVLFIEKGDIFLEGCNYGFIGGASAKISMNEIFFFGDLRLHRNYNEICAFLSKYNCLPVFIENVPLTDVGGLVILNEFI